MNFIVYDIFEIINIDLPQVLHGFGFILFLARSLYMASESLVKDMLYVNEYVHIPYPLLHIPIFYPHWLFSIITLTFTFIVHLLSPYLYLLYY